MSADLIEQLFLPAFGVPRMPARRRGGAARPNGRLAISTDTFVVKPMFFPGGSIGDLAVNGTVNDLAMVGARLLTCRRRSSWPKAHRWPDVGAWRPRSAKRPNAPGYTWSRATPRSSITTAATAYTSNTPVGVVPTASTSGPIARPGDVVLISGAIGEHGVAVMSVRDGID